MDLGTQLEESHYAATLLKSTLVKQNNHGTSKQPGGGWSIVQEAFGRGHVADLGSVEGFLSLSRLNGHKEHEMEKLCTSTSSDTEVSRAEIWKPEEDLERADTLTERTLSNLSRLRLNCGKSSSRRISALPS